MFSEMGITVKFVQNNHSLSRQPYVIRGLNFQTSPHAQDKLVRVIQGSVFDVAVDIRKGSPTYGLHVSAILSAENWKQMYIPKGFAHAFCTLEPDTEFLYQVTDTYAPECYKGIAFDDSALAIEWPLPLGVQPVLSDKDTQLPVLGDLPDYFDYDAVTGITG